MSPFHSGLNHWQTRWLSDRLHKKNQKPPPEPIIFTDELPKPRKPRAKRKPPENPNG